MTIFGWMDKDGCLTQTLFKCAIAAAAMLMGVTALPNDSLAHSGTEPSGIRIVVIGATARTADELIPQALWRGHEVVAVARRPYRVRFAEHPRLTILEGDVYD